MRFTSALPFITLAPAVTNAFHVGSIPSNVAPITSTSLEARRLMVPVLRRCRPSSSIFFPDMDRMFQEMDEMMESSFAELPRPSSMLSLKNFPQAQGLGLRDTFGFDVIQDEKEFKVSVNVSDVDAKDLDLQLDPDGRVLRLKGKKVQEEGGMKIQSSFEKAVLLHPDVDNEKISASVSGGVLSIVAPKVVKEDHLEEKKTKKIDIHVTKAKSEEPMVTPDDHDVVSVSDVEASHSVPTRLAVETMKNEKVEMKKSETADKEVGEKKWPVRDFPY
eukprot:CCRYP_003468-RA/>CCRYP_003468-RA protein AED:0.46 eAED:0.46 QI:0/-1/0/1/-1/1/1/0/274